MNQSAHHFDTDSLATYLKSELEGFEGPLAAKKFADGQSNPTFLLDTPDRQYVLRRKPPGQLLKSAHAIDREYIVLQALKHSTVPVAATYCLCEDESVIGTIFYVMSYEPGRIFWDPSLPELQKEERRLVFDEIVRRLATIHDIDFDGIGLMDYGRRDNYFERQLRRWTTQYRAAETETLVPVEELITWLGDHMPSDDGQISLIHGDYRLDNLIFQQDRLEVRAVLDWELSTLGHPMADLAYLCMGLRLPSVGHVKGLGGLDRKALGIPLEPAMVRRYCQLRGIDEIQHWTFYLAFSFFRLTAIIQGVMKRALDGNASSELAQQVGCMAGPLAQIAMDMIQQESQDNEYKAF